MNDKQKKMIETFQCPGCTNGHGTDSCSSFEFEERHDQHCFNCKGHSAGTFMSGAGCLVLGLPRGFNRYGPLTQNKSDGMPIKLYLEDASNKDVLWDKFNFPTWAMVSDGFLFVRTYSPRINQCRIQVFKGKDLSFVLENWKEESPCPMIDLGTFYDEID